MGRKKPTAKTWTTTEADRKKIQRYARAGVSKSDIALLFNVTLPTLERRFGRDIAEAMTERNAEVADALFENATAGAKVEAQKFWLKSQAGWDDNPGGDTNIQIIQNKEHADKVVSAAMMQPESVTLPPEIAGAIEDEGDNDYDDDGGGWDDTR